MGVDSATVRMGGHWDSLLDLVPGLRKQISLATVCLWLSPLERRPQPGGKVQCESNSPEVYKLWINLQSPSLLFGYNLFALWFTPICNPPCTHSLNTHFPFVRTRDCPLFRPCLLMASAWEGFEKPF